MGLTTHKIKNSFFKTVIICLALVLLSLECAGEGNLGDACNVVANCSGTDNQCLDGTCQCISNYYDADGIGNGNNCLPSKLFDCFMSSTESQGIARHPLSVHWPSFVRRQHFKHHLLWIYWVDWVHTSCRAYLGRRNWWLFTGSWSHDKDGRHNHNGNNGKKHKKNVSSPDRNADDLETVYVEWTSQAHHSLSKWWSYLDHDLIYGKATYYVMLWYGKMLFRFKVWYLVDGYLNEVTIWINIKKIWHYSAMMSVSLKK